jgi:hypothetical protein
VERGVSSPKYYSNKKTPSFQVGFFVYMKERGRFERYGNSIITKKINRRCPPLPLYV